MRYFCLFLLSQLSIPHHLVGAKLVKVLALGRHGNRTPNAQALAICPKPAAYIFEEFKTKYANQKAALSRVGLAECAEAGKWLRKRYVTDAAFVDGSFYDTEQSFFYSERMDRNVVSLHALVNFGLYPPKTGVAGFAAENPNVVPMLTAPAFKDTIMNLPRDGPCKRKYGHDKKAFAKSETLAELLEPGSRGRGLVKKFGEEVCGFDFFTSTETTETGGHADLKKKDLGWTLKAAGDMFNFARNEGINVTQFLPPQDKDKEGGGFLDEVINFSSRITNAERFGKRHQLTYWLGDFYRQVLQPNFFAIGDGGEKLRAERKEKLAIPGVAPNAKQPDWNLSPEQFFHHQKLLVFMNHREFLVALNTLLGVDFGVSKPLPSGSMMVMELHEEDVDVENVGEGKRGEKSYFLKFLAWTPSQPEFRKKQEYLESGQPMLDLYEYGHAVEVVPTACGADGKCTIAEIEAAFGDLERETGTWEEVCRLREEAFVTGEEAWSSLLWGGKSTGGVDVNLAQMKELDEQGGEHVERSSQEVQRSALFGGGLGMQIVLLGLFAGIGLLATAMELGRVLQKIVSAGSYGSDERHLLGYDSLPNGRATS